MTVWEAGVALHGFLKHIEVQIILQMEVFAFIYRHINILFSF